MRKYFGSEGKEISFHSKEMGSMFDFLSNFRLLDILVMGGNF